MKKLLWLMVSLALVLGLFAGPGYGTTVVLSPTFDTYVMSGYTTNFSGNTYIDAGKTTTGAYTMRTYLQFDLSAIPDDNTITGATLTLWCYGFSQTYDYTLNHVAADTAVNSSLTWANQPTTDVSLIATQRLYSVDSYVTWDLKALGLWQPAADLTDNKLSLQLTSVDEVTIKTLAQYRSQEWGTVAERPLLTLEYTAPLPPPPNVPIPGSVWLLSSGLLGLVALRRRSRS